MKKTSLSLFIIFFTLHASLFMSEVHAQANLWITGSGVPGGTQQLVKVPGQQIFKFAGSLLPGEVRIMDTETPVDNTKYLVPRYPDAYIVNNGIPFTQIANAEMPGWVVTFAEDRYRFTVDLSAMKLTGELFDSWDELFIVGGAVECGWKAHVMLPLERVEGERCTYTWTGELKNRSENVEPQRFKFMGQNAWDPKHLHPYKQDELPQNSTCLRTGGDDTKWQINRDGFYRITVDVFRETFSAEYLGQSLDGETMRGEGEDATGIDIASDLSPKGERSGYIYDLQGRIVKEQGAWGKSQESTSSPITHHLSPGVYIIDGKRIVVR